MRVLILTTWYPSATAPLTGTFVRTDAEIIARRHDVEVLHLAPPGTIVAPSKEESGAVRVSRVPMATSSPRDIRRAWRAIGPHIADADVLHSHAFSTLLPLAGRSVRVPWVHTEHWSGLSDPARLAIRERLVLLATARLLNRPDVVTAVSEHLAGRLRAHRDGEILVIPPSVHGAAVLPAPADPNDVRIVAVGGLLKGKDPFLALETIRELRRRGIPARMEWVGEGPLRPALEAAIGSGEEMALLGAQDRDGVARALDRSDLFLLPTHGETLCLSAVEAIAHGRPVVMGDRGGQRDYVRSANGRLVRARTPSAFADAVQDVLTHRLPAQDIADTIGDRFDPETVLEGYDRAYSIARGRRRDAPA